MKKMLSIAVLAIILLAAMVGSVSAATKSEVLEQIYSIGVKYGMTAADKVRLERYLNSSDVTESEANALVGKAQEVAAVFDKAGVTKYDNLTKAQKDEAKAIATEAAKLLDVTLVFKTKSVDVYKLGKKIESVSETDGKLAYTGNDVNVALIAGSIAVIALASVVLVKRTASAK